jgi:hypothetical protein
LQPTPDAAQLIMGGKLVLGNCARESSEGPGYLQARCLADATGGLHIEVETTDDLVAALSKTLGCPQVSLLSASPRVCRAADVAQTACQR